MILKSYSLKQKKGGQKQWNGKRINTLILIVQMQGEDYGRTAQNAWNSLNLQKSTIRILFNTKRGKVIISMPLDTIYISKPHLQWLGYVWNKTKQSSRLGPSIFWDARIQLIPICNCKDVYLMPSLTDDPCYFNQLSPQQRMTTYIAWPLP